MHGSGVAGEDYDARRDAEEAASLARHARAQRDAPAHSTSLSATLPTHARARAQARKRNTMNPPGMTHETEDKGPRLFQASRAMPLDKAFDALGLPNEWLEGKNECRSHLSSRAPT